MNLYPPKVVYSFFSPPGSLPCLSDFELDVFVVSLLTARFNFGNAHIVCDSRYGEVFNRLGFTRFAAITILPDPTEVDLTIFWASKAKEIALTWAYSHSEKGQPILLLDADAIVWNGALMNWSNPHGKLFVGGYREPLHWEAYREQEARLGELFEASMASALESIGCASPLATSWTQWQPVNGSCLYFRSPPLLVAYCTFIRTFIAGFTRQKYAARPFRASFTDTQSAPVYFSEGMMADQRSLGVLLQTIPSVVGDDDTSAFFTTFYSTDEYPSPCNTFLHLWKYKKVLAANYDLQVVYRQSLLRRLYAVTHDTDFLYDMGVTLASRQMRMLDGPDTLTLKY